MHSVTGNIGPGVQFLGETTSKYPFLNTIYRLLSNLYVLHIDCNIDNYTS